MNTVIRHLTNVQTFVGRRMGQGRTVRVTAKASVSLSLSFADALHLEVAVGCMPYADIWLMGQENPQGDMWPQQAGRPAASGEAGKPALGACTKCRLPKASRRVSECSSDRSARS